jgi:hypothetical protein
MQGRATEDRESQRPPPTIVHFRRVEHPTSFSTVGAQVRSLPFNSIHFLHCNIRKTHISSDYQPFKMPDVGVNLFNLFHFTL